MATLEQLEEMHELFKAEGDFLQKRKEVNDFIELEENPELLRKAEIDREKYSINLELIEVMKKMALREW